MRTIRDRSFSFIFLRERIKSGELNDEKNKVILKKREIKITRMRKEF